MYIMFDANNVRLIVVNSWRANTEIYMLDHKIIYSSQHFQHADIFNIEQPTKIQIVCSWVHGSWYGYVIIAPPL